MFLFFKPVIREIIFTFYSNFSVSWAFIIFFSREIIVFTRNYYHYLNVFTVKRVFLWFCLLTLESARTTLIASSRLTRASVRSLGARKQRFTQIFWRNLFTLWVSYTYYCNFKRPELWLEGNLSLPPSSGLRCPPSTCQLTLTFPNDPFPNIKGTIVYLKLFIKPCKAWWRVIK